MSSENSDVYKKLILRMEEMEKEKCNFPAVFAEMFKDEINANDERTVYNGVKYVLKKYADDSKGMEAIGFFTRVITGGASIEEIMEVALEEAVNPTADVEITVDDDCIGHQGNQGQQSHKLH